MNNQDNFTEIYIGPNGVGKTRKIEERIKNLKKQNYKCFYIKYFQGNDEEDVLKGRSDSINNLQEYINKILNFSCSKELKEQNLTKIFREENVILKEIENWEKESPSIETLDFDNIKEQILNDIDLKSMFLSKKNTDLFKKNNFLSFKKNEKEITISIDSINFKFNFPSRSNSTNRFLNHGSGKIAFFQIFLIAKILEKFNEKNLKNKFALIIDEPEIFLHHSFKRKIAYFLRQISKKIKLIFSSHCYEFVNFFLDEKTKIYYKFNYKEEFNEIFLNDCNIFNNFKNRQEFIKTLFSEKVIFCEGNNDQKLLEFIFYYFYDFLELQNEKIDLFSKDITIIETNGKYKQNNKNEIHNNFKDKYFKISENIKNQKYFFIYDDDLNVINENKEKEKSIQLKEINEYIEDLTKNKKNVFSFPFKNNIEKYFGIKNKKNWNPFTFNFFEMDKLEKQIINQEGNFYDFFESLKNFLRINNENEK